MKEVFWIKNVFLSLNQIKKKLPEIGSLVNKNRHLDRA